MRILNATVTVPEASYLKVILDNGMTLQVSNFGEIIVTDTGNDMLEYEVRLPDPMTVAQVCDATGHVSIPLHHRH